MATRKGLRRLRMPAALVGIVCLLAVLVAVASAKVELTANGVHNRVLIPIGAGAIGLRAYSGTGEDVFIRGHLDGPVVRRRSDGSWSATWYCEDQALNAEGDTDVLRIECAGKEHAFVLAGAPVPPAIAPMPERLVVLSDLEGNIGFLDAALNKLGIVGPGGDWQFGDGGLVVLGDSVDRGRDAFAVLWRLHALSRQAQAAGGAVHVVLGNHEQYVLRGNMSRAHPEHRYALREMAGAAEVFAAETVIGAWLRTQPVALKLGDVVFVHGGISPEVVAADLSIRQLNAAMHDYWQTDAGAVARSPALDAVLGNAGVSQYRGYFRELEGSYPAATQAEVERVLAHFGAGQIVVAHTVVEQVERLHGGRVIAVDVNDEEARPEVLTYDNGVPEVVDIGIARTLDTEPGTRVREFSPLAAADRQLVGAMVRAYRHLSDIPQPY